MRADTTSTFVEEDSPPSEKRGDRGKPLKSSIKSFFGLERRDTEEGANTNTLFEKELKRGPPLTSDGHALGENISSNNAFKYLFNFSIAAIIIAVCSVAFGIIDFVQVEYWDVVWNLFAGYWYVL
ncbi:hypothetical protein C8J57DRAFT_1239509 [Mycena rebaudengoi]|nr:hypothetical protein C8J57DRAFT_1239509 [Mycena rebaudengoi]